MNASFHGFGNDFTSVKNKQYAVDVLKSSLQLEYLIF